MLAREIMSSPAVSVPAAATLEEAARRMVTHRVGGLAVVDEDGLLVGFLTDSDFAAKERGVPFSLVTAPQVLGQWVGREGLERIYAQARAVPVSDVMTRPAVAVGEDAPLEDVVRLMAERDVNRVVVAREGRPVGVVARHDLLRLLLRDPPERVTM